MGSYGGRYEKNPYEPGVCGRLPGKCKRGFGRRHPPRQITVTGEGVAHAAPDMAVLTLGVRHQATTAAEALAATNAGGAAAVLAQLSDAGIAPRDMQTSGLSLSPPVWARDNDRNTPPPPRVAGGSRRRTP